jgi:hypothetical protein
MANLKLKNPSGGSLNFVSADGASDLTVTFPATTGTAMVSGNMPAFSAYKSSNQSVSNGVTTKVTFDVEEFDTNNNFASSRFTPTVAGYYQINANVYLTGTANTQGIIAVYIYVNGANYKQGGVYINNTTAGTSFGLLVSSLVYMNGTTDFLEIYGLNTQTAPIFSGGSTQTWFNGVLVRAA